MILLVDDDGIAAPGYRALYRALRRLTGLPVLAVAPGGERSGMGHAITIDRSLAVAARHEDGFFGFAVDGTPADCTKLALDRICPAPPRLVVSGINDGPNAGRSVHYSGTLGAAMEAAVDGLPALAVSRMRGWSDPEEGAEFAGRWVVRLLDAGVMPGTVVNLNLPASPASSWGQPRVARHGRGGFREGYRPVRETGERHAWRLHGEWIAGEDGEDAQLLSAGHPVFSLLRPDLNAPDDGLRRLVGAGL